MESREILSSIVSALDASGIPYMLTGSMASSVHGSPRSTQDIDIVIAPTEASLRSFVSSLPTDRFYVDLEAAEDAFRRKSLFNVIDSETGWKIDFILRKGRAFSEAEFRRRSQFDFSGLKLFIASAEDIILAKLEWAAEGGSLRQLEDVAGVMRVKGPELDFAYIRGWVEKLGLEDQWKPFDPSRDVSKDP